MQIKKPRQEKDASQFSQIFSRLDKGLVTQEELEELDTDADYFLACYNEYLNDSKKALFNKAQKLIKGY